MLKRDKVEGNILQTMKRRKDNWIGHILCRTCLKKRVIEGKIEERIGVRARRGRRHKQLLNDLKERRGYCKLKDEALDRTVWRTRFGSLWTYRMTDCVMNAFLFRLQSLDHTACGDSQ